MNPFFTESPIAMALFQTELAKGNFKKTVTKKEEKFDFSPSKDLILNIAKLSFGLEKLGEKVLSDNLQNSLIFFKKAEKEFADIIFESHPGGSPEIAPAKDELAEIETLPDQHQKILDVINSSPKVSSVILNVADILGVKLAQIPEPEEDVLAQPESKVNKINQSIAKVWAEITIQVQTAIAKTGYTNFDGIKFTVPKLLGKTATEAYLKKYSELSGTPLDSLKNFLKNYNYFYAGGTFEEGPRTIASKINAFDYDNYSNLIAMGNMVDKGIAYKYFNGAQNAEEDKYKNPSSIWRFTWITGSAEKDQAKVQEAANALHEIIKKQYETIFSKIEDANKNLQLNLQGLLSSLVGLLGGKDTLEGTVGTPQLTEGEQTTAPLIVKLTKDFKNISRLSEKGEYGTQLATLLSSIFTFDASGFFNIIAGIQNLLGSLIGDLRNVSLSPLDVFYPTDIARSTASNYLTASKLWADAIDKFPNKAKEYTNYQSMSDALLNAVRVGAGNKYITTHKAITGVGKDFATLKTPQSLQDHSTQWLAKTRELLGIKSASVKISKLAQLLPGGAVPTSTPSGMVNVKPSSSAIPEKEKRAVQNMQGFLYEFGRMLQKESFADLFNIKDITTVASVLINTGKKVGDYYGDGDWGPETARALRNFKILMQSLKDKEKINFNFSRITSLIEGPKHRQSDVVQAAQSNAGIIKDFYNAMLGKTGEKAAAVYVLDSESGVNLTNQDVSSLGAFYQFLIKNRLAEKESQVSVTGTEPTTGISAATFSQWLQHFTARAKAAYENKVDKGAEYYQYMINLYRQLIGMLKSGRIMPSGMIPESLLGSVKGLAAPSTTPTQTAQTLVSGVPGAQGFLGQPTKIVTPETGIPIIPGQRGAGKPGAIGEGTDYGGGLTAPKQAYPLDQTLDLTQDWYAPIYGAYQNFLPNPYLRMDTFRRYSFEDLANSYFPGTADPQRDFYNFINYLSRAMSQAEREWVQTNQPTQQEAEISNQYHLQWEGILKRLRRQFEQLRGGR